MKKIILIISPLFYFSSSTELHEVLRFPLLLKHYSQHRSADSDLSFLDFLKIHYSTNHPNDKDDTEDNDLPFKSKGSLTHIDSPVSVDRLVFEKTYFFSVKDIMTGYTEDIPEKISLSIFHPPRWP